MGDLPEPKYAGTNGNYKVKIFRQYFLLSNIDILAFLGQHSGDDQTVLDP